MPDSSSIIICGQRFDVGRKVITFQEDASINAYTPHCISRPDIFPYAPAKGLGTIAQRYRPRRLIGADRSLSRLQQVLRQFVVHHDGMGTSRDCFKVLHDERGLSVHFLIDNDGTIFQTLDLVDCGFQAAGVNEISIGVELCNRGDALLYPDFYKGRTSERQKVTCSINNHQWLAFDYTKAQYDAMIDLGRALGRIFPGLPQAFPQDGGGEPLWTTLDGDVRAYAGYLGHFHVTNQKWDPGPWDFKRFIQQIRGRVFYPAIPARNVTELPDDAAKVADIEAELFDNNEKEGEGGYFPVGPFGEARLWHGGVHLREDAGSPVVAPFAGKLIAARQKSDDDWPTVGSPNFVLLKHEMAVGGANVRFFTLLLHLAFEKDDGGLPAPAWMKNAKSRKWYGDLSSGEVAVLDEPVSAGDLIGHFGEAGRPGNWKGQLHFEIFSEEELGEKIDPGFWKTVDGSSTGRFCTAPEIVGPIDTNKSGTLARSEYLNFFQNNPAREAFHKLAVRHVSEWADKNDWEVSLNKAKDFGGLSKAQKHKLYADQIEPTLWWTDKLDGLGLPDDKIVWTYHPITFVAWLSEKMKGVPQKAKGLGNEANFAGKKPPDHIKDDGEATDGFMDDEDALFGEAGKNLDLEKLAAGYPDDGPAHR